MIPVTKIRLQPQTIQQQLRVHNFRHPANNSLPLRQLIYPRKKHPTGIRLKLRKEYTPLRPPYNRAIAETALPTLHIPCDRRIRPKDAGDAVVVERTHYLGKAIAHILISKRRSKIPQPKRKYPLCRSIDKGLFVKIGGVHSR